MVVEGTVSSSLNAPKKILLENEQFVRRKGEEPFRVMAWKKNRVRVGKKQAENE